MPRVTKSVAQASAKLVLAAAGVTLALLPAMSVARTAPDDATPTVALASLPDQAQRTHELILQGGPFPYPKDGVVFGNRERLLPSQRRGYYREYTVKTPGSRNRGARRIVCGGTQPAQPQACYYTADHYSSFQRIAP